MAGGGGWSLLFPSSRSFWKEAAGEQADPGCRRPAFSLPPASPEPEDPTAGPEPPSSSLRLSRAHSLPAAFVRPWPSAVLKPSAVPEAGCLLVTCTWDWSRTPSGNFLPSYSSLAVSHASQSHLIAPPPGACRKVCPLPYGPRRAPKGPAPGPAAGRRDVRLTAKQLPPRVHGTAKHLFPELDIHSHSPLKCSQRMYIPSCFLETNEVVAARAQVSVVPSPGPPGARRACLADTEQTSGRLLPSALEGGNVISVDKVRLFLH